MVIAFGIAWPVQLTGCCAHTVTGYNGDNKGISLDSYMLIPLLIQLKLLIREIILKGLVTLNVDIQRQPSISCV